MKNKMKSFFNKLIFSFVCAFTFSLFLSPVYAEELFSDPEIISESDFTLEESIEASSDEITESSQEETVEASLEEVIETSSLETFSSEVSSEVVTSFDNSIISSSANLETTAPVPTSSPFVFYAIPQTLEEETEAVSYYDSIEEYMEHEGNYVNYADYYILIYLRTIVIALVIIVALLVPVSIHIFRR